VARSVSPQCVIKGNSGADALEVTCFAKGLFLGSIRNFRSPRLCRWKRPRRWQSDEQSLVVEVRSNALKMGNHRSIAQFDGQSIKFSPD
jgi:hypothetical protein